MKIALAIILLVFHLPVFAESFAEADALCQSRKDDLLQRLRKDVIQACNQQKEFGDEPGACERFYGDYGNPVFNPKGFQIKKGLFDDIPECQRARELQDSTER